MLLLPLEEDSLLFRLCLYYGALVLLLELSVPLLFRRRVRIEIPRLALRAPVDPLSTREFQHRRMALQQQLMELQRTLEETARWSPEKRRQMRASAAKKRVAASPSPSPSSSPLPSPTSSIKMTRPRSSRKSSRVKLRMDEMEEKDQGADIRSEYASRPMRQRPMAMSELLATRSSRRGGFSFDEVSEEEKEEENRYEQEEWQHAANTRPAKRRESSTFSGRRPVRLVEEMERVGYSAPSEAAVRLEALIRARRRQKAATSTSQVLAPVTAPVPALPPAPASVAPAVESEKPLVGLSLRSPKQPSPELLPQPRMQQDHQIVEKDEEMKESEPNKVLTDFQAFCATFAAGGSAAALQAAAKRKHHEAFESNVKTNGDGGGDTQEVGEKRKQPRVDEHTIGDPIPAAAATPQNVEKRTHHEAFGSDDEKEVDDTVAAQQVLEKRNHDQAFGMAKEQKQEKTPRIVRRISFSDEVDASPMKEVLGQISVGKRTHKQAFGMHDDEDEDADWRDSLAFRPHHLG